MFDLSGTIWGVVRTCAGEFKGVGVRVKVEVGHNAG